VSGKGRSPLFPEGKDEVRCSRRERSGSGGLPPPHPQQDERRRPRRAPRRRSRAWILFCTWLVVRFSLWISATHVRCSRRERTKSAVPGGKGPEVGACRPHTPNRMNAAAPAGRPGGGPEPGSWGYPGSGCNYLPEKTKYPAAVPGGKGRSPLFPEGKDEVRCSRRERSGSGGLPPPHPQQDERRRPRRAPRRRSRAWILFCTWLVVRFSLWISATHVRCSRRERTKSAVPGGKGPEVGACRPHTPNRMNAAAPAGRPGGGPEPGSWEYPGSGWNNLPEKTKYHAAIPVWKGAGITRDERLHA